MGCIGKTVVRAGVITAVVGGVAVAVAGPDRIRAVFHQARSSVHGAIDCNISDPIALRAQLRDLEGQYPKKIGDIRGDLAELNEQFAQLERELAVSRKVVAMAETDLEAMQTVLTKAEEAKTSGVAQVVRVRFEGSTSMTMDDAYGKASRVNQLRTAYAQRVSDIERDLGYLGQQKERLTSLLEQLETERAEFQTQLWALDRQVDAISRNERMIDLMDKRQKTIENHSRYRAASLDQVTARFADIRAKQEAKLQMFSQTSDIDNYENAAKYLLDNEQTKDFKALKSTKPRTIEIAPSVIEIGPDTPKPSAADKDQVASR